MTEKNKLTAVEKPHWTSQTVVLRVVIGIVLKELVVVPRTTDLR